MLLDRKRGYRFKAVKRMMFDAERLLEVFAIHNPVVFKNSISLR